MFIISKVRVFLLITLNDVHKKKPENEFLNKFFENNHSLEHSFIQK